ncbi:MAG: TIGR02453 family protein [Deltaproteobacteria bacterium]|nr:TIGR02453 family protein [Deltaproteobacteria bacterium]
MPRAATSSTGAARGTFDHLPADLLAFLTDLKRHNDRDWFVSQKARFESSVQTPVLHFVEAMAPRLRAISRHLRADARKAGGSVSRIHRDTRFSRDKRPFTTYVNVEFRHAAVERGEHGPSLYVGIQPGGIMIGGGLFHPDGPSALAVRKHIAAKGKAWLRVRDDPTLRDTFGGLAGDRLSRPPAGFPADHPLVDDLKRKDFVVYRTLDAGAIARPGFIDEVDTTFRAAAPLMAFVCAALDLPF